MKNEIKIECDKSEVEREWKKSIAIRLIELERDLTALGWNKEDIKRSLNNEKRKFKIIKGEMKYESL